jgi:hypothetical protein
MRKRLSAKRLFAVGAVGVVAVGATFGLVSAAGASSGGSSAVTRTASGPVTTGSFTFSVSVSGLTPSPVTVTGEGRADFADHDAALTVDIPAVLAKRIPGGSSTAATVNAVLSGATVYVEIPGLASKVGAPWISVALPSKASSAIPGIFQKVALALGDVNTILGFAKSHHATVTPLGTATVDGVHTTGDKIVATVSKKGKSHTVTATVWADSSDRLVKGTVATSGTTKKGVVGLSAAVDFSGYGSPVTITVPPPSQVKPIPWSLITSFLGHGHHGFRRPARA